MIIMAGIAPFDVPEYEDYNYQLDNGENNIINKYGVVLSFFIV